MNKITKTMIREEVSKMVKEKLYKVMKWTGIIGAISTATVTTTLLIQTLDVTLMVGYLLVMLFIWIGMFGHVESEYA